MSPVIAAPLVILYFAAITFIPITIGAEASIKFRNRGFTVLGAVIALVLWGMTIGWAMTPYLAHLS